MTKIAIVTSVDGTLKTLLWAQVEAMQKRGYKIHSVCSEGPHRQWIAERGVKVHNMHIRRYISPLNDLIILFKLIRLFKREKFDVVHTHTPKPSLLGQLAARIAGVPVVINTVHGLYFHDNMKPLPKFFFTAMEWIAGKCSTKILSQNPEDIETAIKFKICKPDKIKLLGNGVDLAKFNPARFNSDFKKKKRIEIGVSEDAIVVGIIGRLVREKGYLELFEAMQRIMADNDKVWLVVIGREEPEKNDRISLDILKKYGIEARTRWLGIREDIPELLACCNIYVLPSWREGFPRSAIEAAAMALPIVTTDIRGCRQVVENGKNGLLVPLKDSQELKKALIKLIENPDIRKQYGQAGLQKAKKEFDERDVCKIVLNTYNQCISLAKAGSKI